MLIAACYESGDPRRQRANAARIVTAINAHDPLVTALRELVRVAVIHKIHEILLVDARAALARLDGKPS